MGNTCNCDDNATYKSRNLDFADHLQESKEVKFFKSSESQHFDDQKSQRTRSPIFREDDETMSKKSPTLSRLIRKNVDRYKAQVSFGDSSVYESHEPNLDGALDAPDPQFAVLTEEMNPCNEFVQGTLQEYDKEFKPQPSPEHKGLLIQGPYLYTKTKETYKGQYLRGQRFGYGELVSNDGELYQGFWKEDMKNGQGRLVLKNGDIYTGNFLNNEANGKGKYINIEQQTVYSGQFRDNRFHGKGTEIHKDGTLYEGDYNKGEKHGKGKFVFADRSSYKGDFMNDEIRGHGKFISSKGVVYEGEFLNNLKHGKGTQTFLDDTVYVGDFVQGKMEGQGKLTWYHFISF